MNARSRNFLTANEVSPVVYCSVDDGRVTYRLADGKMFYLNADEARQAPNPRWAYAVLAQHRKEERELLRKVELEARG